MVGNSRGTKAMLLGLQLSLLGFIILATGFWVLSEAIGGFLIVLGVLTNIIGFAAGRGQ